MNADGKLRLRNLAAAAIGMAFTACAAQKPYSIPAHWVDSDYTQPLSVYDLEALSFPSVSEGWFVGTKFLLHVRGDTLAMTFTNGRYFNSVNFIAPDVGWAGAWRDGLWRYHAGEWRQVAIPDDLHDAGLGSREESSVTVDEVATVDADTVWALLGAESMYQARHLPNFDPTRERSALLWVGAGETRQYAMDASWRTHYLCIDGGGAPWVGGWSLHDKKKTALVARLEGGEWQRQTLPFAGESRLMSLRCDDGVITASGVRRDGEDVVGFVSVRSSSGEWSDVALPERDRTCIPSLSTVRSHRRWFVVSCGLEPAQVVVEEAGVWTDLPAATTPTGRVLSISSATFPTDDEGWAIGDGGAILHYAGGGWQVRYWNWNFWDQRWFGGFGY